MGAGQRQNNQAGEGIRGPRFLGVREMTYRLAFMASSTQVCNHFVSCRCVCT